MTDRAGQLGGRAGEPHRQGGAGDAASGVHSNPEIWAPRLARVLDRQRELYLSLEALSLSQSDLIRDDQTDRLLEVLRQRQGLIDRIGELNQELAPFVRDWETLAPKLGDRHRDALRERFEEVSRLVEAMVHRDEADRMALEERRGAIGNDLAELSRGRGAVTAYTRPARAEPARFQDRQG